MDIDVLEVQSNPILLLELAVQHSVARVEFDDFSETKRLFNQVKALSFGRGRALGCVVRIEGNAVVARHGVGLPKAKLVLGE